MRWRVSRSAAVLACITVTGVIAAACGTFAAGDSSSSDTTDGSTPDGVAVQADGSDTGTTTATDGSTVDGADGGSPCPAGQQLLFKEGFDTLSNDWVLTYFAGGSAEGVATLDDAGASPPALDLTRTSLFGPIYARKTPPPSEKLRVVTFSFDVTLADLAIDQSTTFAVVTTGNAVSFVRLHATSSQILLQRQGPGGVATLTNMGDGITRPTGSMHVELVVSFEGEHQASATIGNATILGNGHELTAAGPLGTSLATFFDQNDSPSPATNIFDNVQACALYTQ